MTSDFKVLCLSFWTPPLVRPQSILIGKMIPEWTRQGTSPVVLTYDVCGDWDIKAPVYKIPPTPKNIPTFSRMLEYLPVLKKAANLWKERLYFKELVAVAEEITKKHGIELVFSYSNPQESNILGAVLKKRLGIPFVSHFSDPWVDNPYKVFSGPALWKAKLQEKFVVKHSDRIVFTNQAALDLVMKKYSAEWQKKALVIPHCFDPADYPRKSEDNPRESKFVISHIGAFYKQRNPEFFFRALKAVFEKRPELKQRTALKFIGAGSDYTGYGVEEVNKLLKDYGLEGISEIIPSVEYRESLRHMVGSDCLLVVDADMKGSPFLPSKVIDYAGSGTPIIGITPSGSPTSEVLKKLGYPSFNYEERDRLAKCVEELITGSKKLYQRKEALRDYNVSSTTAKLLDEFRVILKQDANKAQNSHNTGNTP